MGSNVPTKARSFGYFASWIAALVSVLCPVGLMLVYSSLLGPYQHHFRLVFVLSLILLVTEAASVVLGVLSLIRLQHEYRIGTMLRGALGIVVGSVGLFSMVMMMSLHE